MEIKHHSIVAIYFQTQRIPTDIELAGHSRGLGCSIDALLEQVDLIDLDHLIAGRSAIECPISHDLI